MNGQKNGRFGMLGLVMAVAIWVGISLSSKAVAGTVNLLEKYPTTLTAGDTDPVRARPWEFAKSDIYHLTGFSFQVGADFRLTTGPADVGIGHSVDGAVWAIVIPRESGSLSSAVTNQPEAVANIWLRFHPMKLNQIFPPETVVADGNPRLAAQMSVIASIKMHSSWQAGGDALIPEPKDMTADADTLGGPRRFFAVDTAAATADYFSYFEQKFVPLPPPITPDLAATTFDKIWSAFDKDYAMFILRPEVDWTALKNEKRPLALASQSTYEFAGICADMLEPLRDMHVWLTVSNANVPVYNRPRPYNANTDAYLPLLGNLERSSSSLQWAVTADKIGFIAIYNWTDTGVPAQFDAALDNMRDTRGLIVDVRFNGGGSEPLAKKVAARFVDRQVTYAYSQYRNGPLHTNLTDLSPRTLSPQGAFRYDRPVVVLIGQRCMSSCESFVAMMTCAPQVVTMGDHTAGSSGNPEIIQLPLTMTVSVSQWIDYLPDATPLDEKGITPQVPFTAAAEAFQGQRDDLLSAALQRLKTEPLPAKPIQDEGSDVYSGPTVCDIFLTDGKIYHSAMLDIPAIHLVTEYGELIIPTNDLVRLTFSSLTNQDIADTIQFQAVGQIQGQSFSGHTPGGPFTFQRGELKEIDFGLPATLAARLPEAPLRILWFASSSWDLESIYSNSGWGYSLAAKIAENLGAGNNEVTEEVKLTPELVADYDVLVFLNRDSGGSLTADEKRTLRDFLAAGKGVLVIGQQDGGYPLSPAAQFANSVTMTYGIELTTMTPNTSNPPDSSRMVSHPVTKGITSAPGGGSLLKATPPAQVLALTGTNTGVLAVSTYGTGRMVVVSDDSSLWDDTINPKYDFSGQRNPYAVNIFKWLLLRPPHLSASVRLDSLGCHLTIRAGIGQSVRVQRSADLIQWTDIKSVNISTIPQEVIDDTAILPGPRFYRAVMDE